MGFMEQTLFDKELENMKSQSLSKAVEMQLERMIVNGELAPGERINESYLSNRLKISRAPIREACRQLAQFGMVENRVGKGSFVCQVTLEEAIELYELRGVLDALAAEKAAQFASDDEINQLSGLIEKMRVPSDAHKTKEYFVFNLDFHQCIIRASHNKSLQDMYQVVFKKLSLFRQMTLAQDDRLQLSLIQHEQIFNAIKQKDSQLASKLAREHVEEAKEVLRKQLN